MAAEEESGQSSPHEVRERVRGEPNVLFLVPAMSDIGPDACLDCFVGDDVGGSQVLAVSYTRSADALLESWRNGLEGAPAAITVVTVGETTRSATASIEATETAGPIAVESLDSPDDLTGLGIAIGQQLSEWESREGPTYLCFDSLTVLLQYAELQRAFRFLHVLSGRVAGFDAYAHYHLDPTAVDDRAVATVASLFDAVVQYEDGSWAIRGQ
jgi:hypothetical protein